MIILIETLLERRLARRCYARSGLGDKIANMVHRFVRNQTSSMNNRAPFPRHKVLAFPRGGRPTATLQILRGRLMHANFWGRTRPVGEFEWLSEAGGKQKMILSFKMELVKGPNFSYISNIIVQLLGLLGILCSIVVQSLPRPHFSQLGSQKCWVRVLLHL